jgi:hypothetical protein
LEYLLYHSAADSSAFLVTSFYASPRSPAPFATAMASGFGVLTPKGRCYPFWLVSPSPLSALWPAFCSFPLTRSRAGLHEVHAGRRHEEAVAVQAAGGGLRRVPAPPQAG